MYGVFFYQMCRLRESWEWWWPSVKKIGHGDVVVEEAEGENISAARIRLFLQLLDSGKLSCSLPQ